MQVIPANAAVVTTAQPSVGATVRVLSGNLASLPVGTLVPATVTQVSQGQAVIVVNGQSLSVRTTGNLQPGQVLLLRSPPANVSASQTLELLPAGTTAARATLQAGIPTTSPSAAPTNPPVTPSPQPAANTLGTSGGTAGAASSTASTSTSPPGTASGSSTAVTQSPTPTTSLPLARVDVLAVLPDGRVRIQIEGQEETATTAEQLLVGGKYVVQVERTAAGLMLSTAPDTPDLPTALSAAILRGTLPPDLGVALEPLLAELAELQTQHANIAMEASTTIQKAVVSVRDAVNAFLPSDGRPLSSTELQKLVADGGLHFEAKLARLVNENSEPVLTGADSHGEGTTPAPGETSKSPDLKEALLRLLEVAREFGSSLPVSAAKTALDGIEAQQAANVFAQAQGTPYILQVPFPDGGHWRTLHLAIQSDGGAQSQPGGSNSFRMLMHIPLTDLGETWIDAGLTGNNFRAVLYLDRASARESVRAELPGLRNELLSDGFSEVLLDVRPTSQLPAQQRKQAEAMQVGRSGSRSVVDVRA